MEKLNLSILSLIFISIGVFLIFFLIKVFFKILLFIMKEPETVLLVAVSILVLSFIISKFKTKS